VRRLALKVTVKKELSSFAAYGMVALEAMSEFKFACPVCGQHITADPSTSGGQIECPTCFQKIVVPQAPESGDAKFILSAAQVGKPRPVSDAAASQLGPLKTSCPRSSIPALIVLLVVLGGAGAALFVFRDRLFHAARAPAPPVTNALPPQPTPPVVVRPTYPVPTNFSWTLELTNAVFPDTPLAGKIHGNGFFCEKAVLLPRLLLFGQGKAPPYDLGFGTELIASQSEELSGKTVEVAPDQPGAPRVGWRWKDELQHPFTQIISNGYLLRVAFGQATNGRMPGKIYFCLPDADQSFAAGTFVAEIRKSLPPKPGEPKSNRRKR